MTKGSERRQLLKEIESAEKDAAFLGYVVAQINLRDAAEALSTTRQFNAYVDKIVPDLVTMEKVRQDLEQAAWHPRDADDIFDLENFIQSTEQSFAQHIAEAKRLVAGLNNPRVKSLIDRAGGGAAASVGLGKAAIPTGQGSRGVNLSTNPD
jgi:hypothetical protein